MIFNIYAVFDAKTKAHTTPFFDHSEGRAIRTFADCCNDIGHQFGKHPEDYTLFSLGTYDDELGTITQDSILSVATGHTLIGK